MTGGMLITALVPRCLGKVGSVNMRMETMILSKIHAFLLAMFLAVVRMDAGA